MNKNPLSEITKPSITRLARKAGIKSVSEECFGHIRCTMVNCLSELISTILIVNSEHRTKTLMSEDIYAALALSGYNVTQSSDLGTSTCHK